jgi:dTDP-4-amino-4,6-dideoxygalactose transaminase
LIPFIDLKAQHEVIKEELDAAIRQVSDHCQFILGPEVRAFEQELAEYCGTGYAVGVASGTDAIRLALLACGVGEGDEVITTPFTFVSTIETVIECGAVPVFADIEPDGFNIDPLKIEEKITPRTRAILPVHLYGRAADMGPIMELAGKHRLKVIEDCAQALGTEYDGRKVGAVGDAGCLSFFPTKNLGAFGDAGAVITGNPETAETVRMLGKHGGKVSYFYNLVGFNSRLDTLQAAILSVKLKYLDEWISQRRNKAGLYNRLLTGIEGIYLPEPDRAGRHSFNYYTIRVDSVLSRNKLREYLTSKGIQTIVYYPLSLHLQEAYKFLGYKPGDFPESERAQEEVISLPLYPVMSEEHVEEVSAAVKQFVRDS